MAERIERSIREINVPIRIHSQVKGHEAILAMVSAGLGCAMLPVVVREKLFEYSSERNKYKQRTSGTRCGLFVKKEENNQLSPQKKIF